jgi:Leucine-rich repeat (LRR) protein
MKKLVSFVCFAISLHLSAQEVMVERDDRNADGTYTSYEIAKEYANEVKRLDIKKDDADRFLKTETVFPNLTYLSIHFANKSSISKNFEGFTNLETAAIRYSWNLSSLPRDFTLVKSLRKLHVYNCGLTQLSDSFFSNPLLQSVGICGNKLQQLPAIPVDNTIQYLNIGHNQISQLPQSFENLKKLKELSLKALPIEVFPAAILNFTELDALELSKTKITVLPEGLSKLTKLKYLYLVGMNLQSLPSSLKKSNLTNVYISKENLTEKQQKNIIKSLPKNCKVEWTAEDNQLLSGDEPCYCER